MPQRVGDRKRRVDARPLLWRFLCHHCIPKKTKSCKMLQDKVKCCLSLFWYVCLFVFVFVFSFLLLSCCKNQLALIN